MASLIDELLTVLADEKKGYDAILALSPKKRDAIVHGDVPGLEKITSEEEDIASDLKNLSNRQIRIMRDMATVLGKDSQTVTVTQLIGLLKGQPEEQQALAGAKDALVESAKEVKFWNDQNQILLKQALEMVDFDLTLFKSMKQAPETANYNKNAYNTGDLLGGGSFDSRQ